MLSRQVREEGDQVDDSKPLLSWPSMRHSQCVSQPMHLFLFCPSFARHVASGFKAT